MSHPLSEITAPLPFLGSGYPMDEAKLWCADEQFTLDETLVDRGALVEQWETPRFWWSVVRQHGQVKISSRRKPWVES